MIEDFKGYYKYLDITDINSGYYRDVCEWLPFIDFEKQKENFYYVRNAGTGGFYYNINRIFEKLGYDEYDIRRLNKAFGYDGKNRSICIAEATINLTVSPPTISYNFIPISPEGVSYIIYKPLPKVGELKKMTNYETLETFFNAVEQRNTEMIDEIYPSNNLTDPEMNMFYKCSTQIKNLKIQKIGTDEYNTPLIQKYNVFAVGYDASHFHFLGFSQGCQSTDNIPIGYGYPPEDYEKNGGTPHDDQNANFYAMDFDENKGHWIIVEVNTSP